MDKTREAIEFLKGEVEKKEKRTILNFNEFLDLARLEPQRVLRNIFQLFYDMFASYVGEGKDEYPDDPENIGFVEYDCSRILVSGVDNPFFADRLFANRLIRQVKFLTQGSQQNCIYVFDGPHGCGKSTFLNSLLQTFEKYTETKEGQMFELFWDIELEGQKIEVFCPSHDHPILIIPRNYRAEFLGKLLPDKMTEFNYKLFHEKEYEWVFQGEACTICKSLFWTLFDRLGSLDKVLGMVKIRSYLFDRRLGEGISVFNPGDWSINKTCLTDTQIQDKLDKIFGANLVKYVFSRHARTNNGVYVLADIKSHNQERFLELHNIISEGVHKIDGIEERINSLFIALMNPEDKEFIEEKKVKSFRGRIRCIKIPYVMEVSTEAEIYRNIFGQHIDGYFLPGVLENFARIIISSRMNADCQPLKKWISDLRKYKKYCDEAGLLLRMEIYGGIIPPWLMDEDKKGFTSKIRRLLIAEGEKEGQRGFSGRDSIELFSEFLGRYGDRPNLITMSNVTEYFTRKDEMFNKDNIPANFIISLVNWYDYTVLNEVKESLYFYNEKQITEDIVHYFHAINYNIGEKTRCKTTGKEVAVTMEFLKQISSLLSGEKMNDKEASDFAKNMQQKYVKIVAQDPGAKITDSELYKQLFDDYRRNLKKKSLEPFLENNNFSETIKFFGTKEFETCDIQLKKHVTRMMKNLVEKFGYTEKGAKTVCLYVIDKKLVEKFS